MPEAVVVGSGPNGLAAAIVLAQAGVSVEVLEEAETVGGGMRSGELTLPRFVHDHCAAIHPLALGSPFLRALPLADYGLEWLQPPAPLAHPFDDGGAVLLERSIAATGAGLGSDGGRYVRLLEPLCREADGLLEMLLGPAGRPRHPAVAARFALRSVLPASLAARGLFRGSPGRALFAGLSAHSTLPLSRFPSAAFGLVLALLGHSVGWPLARGGSQRIADALVAHLRVLGGEVETGRPVRSLRELGGAQLVLLDVSPRQLVALGGPGLPQPYRRRLERFRHGPGVFKLDWALAAPIPWRAPECARAATVHLGGSLEEIAASEAAVWRSRVSARPFVILAQQSLFDATRAPAGAHTAWAYCHVPNGSRLDLTAAVEAQVERFAPGFRERIIGRSAMGPAEMEAHNRNYVGGDINGGAANLSQLWARPVPGQNPYATPIPGLFLCSASTPPGGGVHGMCGFHAARAALRYLASA